MVLLSFKFFLLVLLFAFCFSCSTNDSAPPLKEYQEIAGRHSPRKVLYRAWVPSHWKRVESSETITDTRTPLVGFVIKEGEDSIKITLHNFPTKVPSIAQLERWQKQFQKIDQTTLVIKPQAFSGFYGYHLAASGLLKGQDNMLLAWAMELASEHIQLLDGNSEASASITIKAVGSTDLMQKHKKEISRFAQSFELIEELPNAFL